MMRRKYIMLIAAVLGGLTLLIAVQKLRQWRQGWERAELIAQALPMGYTRDLPTDGYRVIRILPHDRRAFVEGLAFAGGSLFESAGGYGQSAVRRIDPSTGDVMELCRLEDRFFGEGLAAVGEKLYQLTWREQAILVWDRGRLAAPTELEYPAEGWGLTSFRGELIASDGSSNLVCRDVRTLKVVRQIAVQSPAGPVSNLNELEVVGDELWANVWMTNFLVRIDPVDGKVLGWVDLNGLLGPLESARADVLNGIAYDPETRRLLVTGKNWPKLFEIEVRK